MRSLMLALLLLSVGAVAVGAQEDAFLVLEGGTLIDGRGGAPIEDAVIVVRGERIWAVGRRGEVPIPAGANVIQTSGRTSLPGLIDMHLHSRPCKFPLYLAHGVTTVGDIHADTPWIIAQRALLRSGVMQGPRLFVSGARVIGPLMPGPARAFGDGYVRDVHEARDYVRYLAEIGVDMVKVDATITGEQLVAVIHEAKRFDLPVLGHLRDIDFAMSHGMKEMEHLAPFWRSQLVREGKPLPAAGSEEGAELMASVDTTRFGPLIQRMVEQEVIVDIVEGNPLVDIRATRNIRMVIQGGKVVGVTYDPTWVNPIPRPASVSPI